MDVILHYIVDSAKHMLDNLVWDLPCMQKLETKVFVFSAQSAVLRLGFLARVLQMQDGTAFLHVDSELLGNQDPFSAFTMQ